MVALVIAMSAGRALSASPVEGLTQQTLATGLTVVLVEDHWHPIAALEVCYRIGSRSDPYGKQGLAHLLEHLTFPSPAFRHEGDTKPTALLGRAGATTNHDTTCYSQRLLSAEIERALAVEAERMATLRVGPEDLEREKVIVIKERRQLVEGDTWRNVLEEVDSAAFRLHPYRFPTSGWPETLEHITLADVQRHFAAYYSPANAVLVAVGDFHSQELLAFIEAHFGKIPARPLSAPSAVVEPAQGGERRILFAPLAAPRLVSVYHVPAFGSQDHAALTILSAVLAGGENTRLPALLYPPHLAEDVGIEYSPLNRDPGLFYIKVALGSRVDFRLTGEAIDDVLWHLREDGLHSGELTQAKKHLLLDFFLEQSSIGARAGRLAQYGVLSALPQAQRYTDDIRAVTEADVRRVVSAYFSPENRVAGITGVAHQEGERRHKEGHAR